MEQEKLTIWDRMSLWWTFNGRYAHYDFYYGIKNLIKWFKIVWKDRDYDDFFIFEVLKFKIENTAKYTERRQWFVGWEHEVSRMETCIELIDRIQNEYYEMEYLDYEESNHYFVESDLKDEKGENLFELKSETKWENFEKYFKKYPSTYKKVVKECGSDETKHHIAIKMGYHNQNKAKRLLFNILHNHIENWWE